MKIKKGYANLFNAPPDFALAHCVASDFRLGAGIALQFRQRYPKMIEYLNENKFCNWPSIITYKTDENQIIYNLVTKELSHYKPTRESLNQTLIQLKEHCIRDNVTKLAIPLLGAGLDRLLWEETELFIQDIFEDMNIHIAICMLKKRV